MLCIAVIGGIWIVSILIGSHGVDPDREPIRADYLSHRLWAFDRLAVGWDDDLEKVDKELLLPFLIE